MVNKPERKWGMSLYYEKKGVDYEEYVRRQGRKANNPEKRKILLGKKENRIKKFEKIFEEVKDVLVPGNMLCLGARTGCEIKAAKNVGFDSQGIDLYPLDSIVIQGDWHNIPFSTSSFNNVYTNSVDHCFDVEKLAKEIKRVLVPEGLFFFQVSKKQKLETKEDKEDYIQKSSNFLFWKNGRTLAGCFCQFGFVIVKEYYDKKWESFILRNV